LTLLDQCNGRIKVLALTAIRSEYDLLYPLMNALRLDKNFDVAFIVAGAHLTSLHNYSVNFIKADNFRIAAEINNFKITPEANSIYSRVRSAAILLEKLVDVLEIERPDLLVFLGDREEPLMASIAANYLGIPSIHLAGGDNAHPVGGDVDEEARHATTKLSHIHLTMADAHSKRIAKMGEEPWRISTVGNPGLDRLRSEPPVEISTMKKILGEGISKDYIVLIYHAVSSGLQNAPDEFRLIIETCLETGLEIFIGAPNNDPGYADLLQVSKEFSNNPKVNLYSNIPRPEFISLLKGAKLIIGNSSLGILEASFIKIPAINVGERQRGRLAALNVQFVHADAESIRGALNKALTDIDYLKQVKNCESIYGDGYMVNRALTLLKLLPTREKILDKKITY
jgi:GDP/UDP-N,N'-diacetylbacillosamine 2-epimerase (hydrolysing)